MTVENAIKSLIFIRDSVLQLGEACDTTTEEKAIDMAIEALEKQIPKEARKTAFSIDRYVEKDVLTGQTMCPVCGNTIFFQIVGSF